MVLKEIQKRWRQRLSAACILLSLCVVLDEIIKEGYTLDPIDFISPQPTHEKLFALFLLVAILVGRRKKRG